MILTKIYIDADGCPVKEEAYKVAFRYQIPVIVVANKAINIPLHPLVTMQVVSQGPDEADNWIAENIQAYDICITADIPLADKCLKKSAKVLNVRGEEFTEDMIGDAMATRELMRHLRELGEIKGGPPPFEKRDRSAFLGSLDRIIQAIRLKSV
ncbi:YaiI/YqxD family protein [Peredibacter sp. HCB2-198]|uniref:YaiI/YqxD family protein n=1 Tax=Peredibacter sp. HCB2-198 TaxID=3383025 RepID=UPI0038B48B43